MSADHSASAAASNNAALAVIAAAPAAAASQPAAAAVVSNAAVEELESELEVITGELVEAKAKLASTAKRLADNKKPSATAALQKAHDVALKAVNTWAQHEEQTLGRLARAAAAPVYYKYDAFAGQQEMTHTNLVHMPREEVVGVTHEGNHVEIKMILLVPQERKFYITRPLPPRTAVLEPLRAFGANDRNDWKELKLDSADLFSGSVQQTAYDLFHARPSASRALQVLSGQALTAAIESSTQLLDSWVHDANVTGSLVDARRGTYVSGKMNSYVLFKQQHNFIRVSFPFVPSNADVAFLPEDRTLRVDGVFFRVNGWVEPFEWREGVEHRYGVVRYNNPLGLDIFLPKAVPTYWPGVFFANNPREQRKALYIQFLCFPITVEEGVKMKDFVLRLKKLLSLTRNDASNTHVGDVNLTLDIISSLEDLRNYVYQRRKEPVDLAVLLGHGDGQSIRVGEKGSISSIDLMGYISRIDSLPDPNIGKYENFQWSVNGLKMIIFLNCNNGGDNGIAAELAEYPVATLSFKRPVKLGDLTDPNSYCLWFLWLYAGWKLGQGLAMDTVVALKEIMFSETDTIVDEADLVDRAAAIIHEKQSLKQVPIDFATLREFQQELFPRSLGDTYEPLPDCKEHCFSPVVRNARGFNNPAMLSWKHIKLLGKDKVRKCVGRGTLFPYFMAVCEAVKEYQQRKSSKKVEEGPELNWRRQLGEAAMTKALSVLKSSPPAPIWRNPAVIAAGIAGGTATTVAVINSNATVQAAHIAGEATKDAARIKGEATTEAARIKADGAARNRAVAPVNVPPPAQAAAGEPKP